MEQQFQHQHYHVMPTFQLWARLHYLQCTTHHQINQKQNCMHNQEVNNQHMSIQHQPNNCDFHLALWIRFPFSIYLINAYCDDKRLCWEYWCIRLQWDTSCHHQPWTPWRWATTSCHSNMFSELTNQLQCHPMPLCQYSPHLIWPLSYHTTS